MCVFARKCLLGPHGGRVKCGRKHRFEWIIWKHSHPKWESKAAFGKPVFFKMAAMKHI